jgi:acetylornithine deacetylase
MNGNSKVIELLARLVAVGSVNPSLVPGGAGEGEAAALVAGWAAAAGLQVEVIEQTAGRPSVIVRTGKSGHGATLLLCGHLDTVGVGGMSDPLLPRVHGDRLYARGGYDMKAGLAAALVACSEAAKARISGEVIVAAVADEEHASIGVQEALTRISADAAIVTEPTELTVATAHKGFVWTEIQVIGKAAHGSRPHLGVDAILKTGPILVALNQMNERLRAGRHPMLGPGSVHASLIRGGSEASTIPGQCRLTIERRTLPGETLADIEADIDVLIASCRAADPELVASARTVLARDPFETMPTEPLITTVAESASAVLGRPADVGGVSYWADSAFISAAGIPTVLFGPSGDGAHADTEWVSLSSTITCARVLTAVAIQYCH